ncbi:hypothetical protein LCGC14_3158490 [marine sediment metagenome]|uniref:Uncharacterized protein n=1 Tax=marine sediment metagenome TaxID=412755 RepID=A0A0F8VRY4_9ZZZZ
MTGHNDHDFGGPRNQCPFCRADLEAENARLQERLAEARAFQQAFRDERDKAQRKLKEVGCAYASRKFSEAGRLIQELDRILSKEGE